MQSDKFSTFVKRASRYKLSVAGNEASNPFKESRVIREKGGFFITLRFFFSLSPRTVIPPRRGNPVKKRTFPGRPSKVFPRFLYFLALTACNGFSGNSPDSRSLSEWKRDTKERAAETSKIIQAEQAGHLSPGADHSACDKALQKAIQAEAESESADTRERAKRANDKVREALKQAKDCAKGGREKAAANRVAHEAGRIAEQAREIAAQVKNEAEVRKKYYEELSPGNSAGKQSAGKHPAIDKALKTAEEVETEADKIKAEMESADTESKASALLKRAKAARSKIEDAYISLLRF